MNRPLEQDYTSLAAYTRALEEYCDTLSRVEQEPVACKHGWFRTDAMLQTEFRCIKCGAFMQQGDKHD